MNQSQEDDYHDASSYSSYRSQITPRTINIQRARNMAPTNGVMTRMIQSYTSHGTSFGAFGSGGLASLANFGTGIPLKSGRAGLAFVDINDAREREKRALAELNDKFAQYVEKVRFLEAQNRKLQMELEALQNRSGHGSSRIKEMYDVELAEARKLIDDTTKDCAASDIKAQKAIHDVARYKQRYGEVLSSQNADRLRIDRLHQQIAENVAQIELFRRRLTDLDDEMRRYKAETQRLTSEIARLQNEIQQETFFRTTLEGEKLGLEDEITTLKDMRE
ncbi:unnamed protein product [Didymodactylos carnosus]|uniref:IF rod domain-containing protein n=1 Tax=Didymodactylos carnosus TaxID=1234261 RepID=A0A815ZH50_9BILA|nr:unnamed protein product [Didymodactylos carnosus]CAF1584728.1 unnamed protein product [Didymodactylos carnosus]CAF3719840.1 unnamed protein product [Didymodactylos carnosus]CAF4453751.1 unnamed protein product [Didymodactylos carnosus]